MALGHFLDETVPFLKLVESMVPAKKMNSNYLHKQEKQDWISQKHMCLNMLRNHQLCNLIVFMQVYR